MKPLSKEKFYSVLITLVFIIVVVCLHLLCWTPPKESKQTLKWPDNVHKTYDYKKDLFVE